jgi:hypothetical protein
MKNSNINLARATYHTAAFACVVCMLAVSAYALTPSGAQIKTSSTANYNDSTGTHMPVAASNTVTLTVVQVGGVQLSPATGSVNTQPGVGGYVPVAITNTGNGSDTFSLTVAGDSSWSPKIIVDSNGDGVHQSTETTVVTKTTAIAAGASYKCFVLTTPPSGATAASTFTLTAASALDPTKKSQGAYTVTPTLSTRAPYIREWLLNGYYSNTSMATRLTTDYLGGEASSAPRVGQIQAGKTWALRKNTTDLMDFLSVYGSGMVYCATYSATYVYSPSDKDAQLWIGSNDGVKVWLNGANVWTKDVLRGCVADQDKVAIHLTTGWNRLLFKVAQNTSNWALIARVCDTTGNAVPGVTVSTAPPVTATALVKSAPSPTLPTSRVHATSITTNWATSQPAAFITDWLTNGFYPYADRATRMATDFLDGEATARPEIGTVSGQYQWIPATAGSDGYLDLGQVYGDPLEGVGYAGAYIYSSAKQDGELRMGSYGGIQAYFNGQAIWTNDVYRTWTPDEDTIPVTLEQGWNCLLMKVTQGGDGWGVSAKLCDSSGNRLPGIGSKDGS